MLNECICIASIDTHVLHALDASVQGPAPERPDADKERGLGPAGILVLWCLYRYQHVILVHVRKQNACTHLYLHVYVCAV